MRLEPTTVPLGSVRRLPLAEFGSRVSATRVTAAGSRPARWAAAAMRDRAPDLPRGLLLWEKPGDWSAAARALACHSVHCAARHLTPDWAAEIKRQGYLLAVYTVNDPDLAKRLRRWGADSIITDRPGALSRAEGQAAEPGARSGQLESS